MGHVVPDHRRKAARRVARLASLLVLMGFAASAAAAPAAEQSARAQLAQESSGPAWMRWDRSAARPKLVHGSYALPESDHALGVRRFLERHAELFGLDRNRMQLEFVQARTGLAGTYWRFHQHVGGLPVFGGEVVALTRDGGPGKGTELRALNLSQRELGMPGSIAPRIDGAAALEAARIAIGVAPAAVQEAGQTLGIDADPPAALAYRVNFETAQPPGAWEAFVDASDGTVRSFRNRIQSATGTGLVFDPNPVATTGDTTLKDNNDATSPALDAARYSVQLQHLDGSGFLRGSYVDARPSNANQRAQSAQFTFEFSRKDSGNSTGFEEVMAYYHIDRAQQRIQSLGFDDVDKRQQVVFVNAITDDNSFYSPINKSITFGTGGVDDAEDADVILHEYGHSIQDDQVPGFGGGDEGSMGEGFGDYLEASFNDVLSQEIVGIYCFGDWDAVAYVNAVNGCDRVLGGDKHYPEDWAGEVHRDGEMWSAALLDARSAVGADTMDRLVIESHFLLSTNESFQDAADAIVSTDQTLNAGAHVDALQRAFVARGVSRALTAPSALFDVVESEAVSVDNPRGGGGLYLPDLDDTKTITRPGAAALRVHFESIETEAGTPAKPCARGGGGCDNIYLYDAEGRLYQILFGTLADVDSVAIPGDTVRVRLVSDATVGKSGYHIDRVDTLDSGIFADSFEIAD